MKSFKKFIKEQETYRGSHRAPMKNESNAMASDVDLVMPDYYEHPEYYSHMSKFIDNHTHKILSKIRNKLDAEITIYRAIPKSLGEKTINPGDWVTVNKHYATEHCKVLDVPCQILTKKVKASELYTNGDSPHEFGYDPS
jgi:hypothetical protein